MKIAIASDHAGYQMKEFLKPFIRDLGHEVHDFGAHSEDPVDYPDTGREVAVRVASGEFDRGIVVCATGIGMSIVANKIPGIRAALCTDVVCARLTREHNDTNVLAIGARVTGSEIAKEIVKTWLAAEFAGGRHARRVQKIADIEREYCSRRQ
ncbi:MAG: ribose 5-phosphate isomerase B [Firmicutes bacterium]|nr:ribose 5-phosphate isomerase B [Bacillota bacterium]